MRSTPKPSASASPFRGSDLKLSAIAANRKPLKEGGLFKAPLLRLLAGSLCISFSPIFIRLADVPPDSAGFYRMLFSGLALLVWLTLSRKKWRIPRLSIPLLVAAGLFLGVDFMCWHRSIHLVGPGLSTLLGNFQVFFTALFSWIVLRQKISPLFGLAVALALTGLALIAGVDPAALDAGTRQGFVFGLSTAVFYSGYLLSIRGAMARSDISAPLAMFAISVVCTFFMGTVTIVGGVSLTISDTASLLALIGAGVISTTLGWSLISSALREVTATLAGLMLLLQPALSFVWDVILFARPTTEGEVGGIILILAAIYLGSRPVKDSHHEREE